MHDDQKELFEILFAGTLNILFLVLLALFLWPLGRQTLAFHLAKGYVILWVVVCLSALVLNRVQGLFRVNLYDHANAYVISNLSVSCFLQVGWSAFAALTVHNATASAPLGTIVILYLVGLLSCLVAFYAVSSFYRGHIYKLISLPLALISFVVFCVWPAAVRATYGRFFELF